MSGSPTPDRRGGAYVGMEDLCVQDEPLILIKDYDTGVRLIQLNRPRKRNALTVALVETLAEALTAADADPAVGAIVVTGDRLAFCAGSDISDQNEKGTGHVFSSRRLAAWERIGRVAKPTIAAVNGYALGGGCELMLLLDFAIAGEDAMFGTPEINLGVFPGDGATQRLTRRIGRPATMRLIFTGERINARRAWELGLVTEVVAPEQAVERALAVAATIASKSPLALQMAKRSIIDGEDLSMEEGLALEQRNLATVFEGEDWKLGMRAFVDKAERPSFLPKPAKPDVA